MHNAVLLAFDGLLHIHLYTIESKIHQYQCKINVFTLLIAYILGDILIWLLQILFFATILLHFMW